MQITPMGAPRVPIQNAIKGAESSGDGFADKLTGAIDNVSDKSIAADDKLAQLASGKDVDLHGTMIAMEEADITLRTMVAVRDKVVNAYQEIMNMAI
jgi:flagellar hook-basal body complex protein FliE